MSGRRILGYPTACTAVDGVTELQRHAITGRAMDRFAVLNLMGVYTALAGMSTVSADGGLCFHAAAMGTAGGVGFPMLPELPQEVFEQSPGFHIMRQQGWELGQPLPAPRAVSAITAPLDVPVQTGRQGLGYVSMLGGGWGTV